MTGAIGTAAGMTAPECPEPSHRDFPDGLSGVENQVAWSLEQLAEKTSGLLEESEHGPAAESVDPKMLRSALESVQSHLAGQGDLRGQAIKDNLIEV